MKIGSFNLAEGNADVASGSPLDSQIDYFKDQQFDILLVAEVSPDRAAVIREKAGFGYYAVGGNTSRECNAIFSKFELFDIKIHTLPPIDGWYFTYFPWYVFPWDVPNRYCIEAQVRVPGGHVISVMCTQFYAGEDNTEALTKANEDMRTKAAQTILRDIVPNNRALTILGGDFNADDHKPAIQLLKTCFQDTYEGAVTKIGGGSASDYFFKSGDFAVILHEKTEDSHLQERYGKRITDHPSILMEVSLPPLPSRVQRVRLKASNGKYVCAEGGGNAQVVANRQVAKEWETFVLYAESGGASGVAVGDRVYLQTHRGYFLCAENGGGQTLVANRSVPHSWETFIMMRGEGSPPGGSSLFANGDKVALQDVSGAYVSAEGGGGREVVSNRSSIGSWETFTLEFV